MPITRKPMLRAEILDQLLAHGKWTGQALLRRLNEKLADLDERPIDARTLKRDLNFLEYEKGAPLHRPESGHMVYYYAEKFSLKDIPLDPDEVALLRQAIDILGKLENFSMTGDLDLIIGKLENRIHTNLPSANSAIQFEDHTRAEGINWFPDIFEAVKERTVLNISYHSFKHTEPKDYVIHPYLLKEYRNRWWLIGRDGSSDRVLTIGLDRIKSLKTCGEAFIENSMFSPDSYFNNAIGVSIAYNSAPEKILVKVYPETAPYIETKRIHKHQELLERQLDGSIIVRLNLIINYELKATILGFGAGVEVLEPNHLREEIIDCLNKTRVLYKQ